MKIVINAASAKMGGAATYIASVLRSLPPPESGYEFDVLMPPETAAGQEGLPENVRLIATPIGHAAWWKRLWWEQVTLRRLLKRRKADVLFSTGNLAMFFCPVPQLLLVCNALYFSKIYLDQLLPRHSPAFRLNFKFRRWLICRSVRQADVVLAPTQAMLNELRQFVEVKPDTAMVNPYGAAPVDFCLRDNQGSARTGAQPAVRLIYVSHYSEHKNLSTLLRAMALLNRDGGATVLLKTTLDPAWQGSAWTVTWKEDLALAQQPDVAPWVEVVGLLADRPLQQLYQQCDIHVFPSFCESFGHPMAQAMGHGIPTVAADTPVNREICGDAAVYFRPLDPEDLAEKVNLLRNDQALREKLGAAGRKRAEAMFRWEDHVGRLLRAADTAYAHCLNHPAAPEHCGSSGMFRAGRQGNTQPRAQVTSR